MTGNSMPPRVSVIIPVHNCASYIHEAVNSVLTQSFSDLELMVIDDGSDDWDYRQLETLDPRVRVIRIGGEGVSRARNRGMKEARGTFLAFLDADDVWFPGKLTAQVRYFEQHPEVGVVFGGFIRWQAGAQGSFQPADQLMQDCSAVDRCEVARSGWLYSRLLSGLLVGMNTAVIRRDVYEAIGGFNEAMRQGEDYDFWLKASRICEMHALDAPVALYRIHGASAMHRLSDENHLSTLLVSASMRWGLTAPHGDHLTAQQFNQRLAQVAFDHGYTHFWHGKRDIARKHFLIAVKLKYQVAKSLAYILLSRLPRIGRLR